MPSTIPYDPSLVLAARVTDSPEISAAEEKFNAALAAKQSLETTINQLISTDADTTDLMNELKRLDGTLQDAAKNLAKAKTEAGQR